jgi:acyl-CoA reductase-like NAD-dependent aldehyde dehydrogenase
VHSSIHDEVLERVVALAETMAIDDPLLSTTLMGSIVSEGHLERILAMVGRAMDDNAGEICTGGSRHEALRPGAFMQATVFSHVDPNSEIAQQEVFGPVLTVFSSEDDDEAVTMATRPSTDSPHSSTPGRSRAPTPWRGASKRVRWRSTAAGPRQSWWRGHAIRWRQGKWLRP